MVWQQKTCSNSRFGVVLLRYTQKGGSVMQTTSIQRERSRRPHTEGALLRLCRDGFHDALMALAGSALQFRVIADNDYIPLPDRPIIFTGNHYCGQDVIVACKVIHGRVQIVAGKQPLTAVDEFFFNANGTIFVDRKDKEDTAACKRAMEALLKSGQNVIIFPEGTSNVSDELLMYPMKWGVIEVARRTGAQIIPVVLHYDKERMECHVHFSDPMIMDRVTNADGIRWLRDTTASVRWEYWERNGLFFRADMDIEQERAENKRLLLSYKLLDYDYEKSVVFHPYPSEVEVFEPIIRAYEKKM